jgi:hypothetical protein
MAQAARHLGLTLHYIADYHIPGARSDAHDPAEQAMSAGVVREAMREAIEHLTSHPPACGPPQRLHAFLALWPNEDWGARALRDTLLCCAETARAVTEPADNAEHLAAIQALQEDLDRRLLDADDRARQEVEDRYRALCRDTAPVKWWQVIKWAQTAYARWASGHAERRYLSRACLRAAHKAAKEELEARVAEYKIWYAPPTPPITVALPEPQWVRVADLAREFLIDRRRAEVILAVHGETYEQRCQGVVWVPREMVSWFCARLQEHLAACRRADDVQELPSGKVRVICDYCGQSLTIEDPGEEYVVKEDCPNCACPRRFAY